MSKNCNRCFHYEICYYQYESEICDKHSKFIDKELVTIKKTKKKGIYTPAFHTVAMQEKWGEWVKFRSQIKKAYKTDRGPKNTERELRKLSNGNESLMVKILDQSMDNEWTGVFALKGEFSQNQNSNNFGSPAYEEFKDD